MTPTDWQAGCNSIAATKGTGRKRRSSHMTLPGPSIRPGEASGSRVLLRGLLPSEAVAPFAPTRCFHRVHQCFLVSNDVLAPSQRRGTPDATTSSAHRTTCLHRRNDAVRRTQPLLPPTERRASTVATTRYAGRNHFVRPPNDVLPPSQRRGTPDATTSSAPRTTCFHRPHDARRPTQPLRPPHRRRASR